MKFFDFHTHIFPDPIAENALNKIAGDSGIKPSFDGTYSGLRYIISQIPECLGVLNCPIATKPEQVSSINTWASTISNLPILSLGTIHPFTHNKKKVLKQLKNLGFKGIKLHPEYQNFSPDDPEMTEIWEYCSEFGLIVLSHAGVDAGIFENIKGTPERFAELINEFPKLKLVLAHFGGWFSWEEVDKFLIGKNLFLDLSFTLGFINNDFLIDMIKRHGNKKILYGTDAPWRDPHSYLQDFLNLKLSPKDNKQILFKNAIQLLDISRNLL